MFDAMVAMQLLVVARYLATGQPPARVGNRHPLSAPFGAFQASDGPFVLAVLNGKLFQALAKCVGAPQLANDPRFARDPERLANEPALRAAIERWSLQRTAREAVAAFIAAGVPVAEIEDMAAVLGSAQASERRLLQETGQSFRVPEHPAHFAGVARGRIAPAPDLDADRLAVLAELERQK